MRAQWVLAQPTRFFCPTRISKHLLIVWDADQLSGVTDPYPYAVDEVFDTYQVLVDTVGSVIGMSGHSLEIIASGDSA